MIIVLLLLGACLLIPELYLSHADVDWYVCERAGNTFYES